MRLGPRVLLVLLLAGSGPAFAQSLEITSDLAGTTHQGTVPPYTSTTVYILARTGGRLQDGITGAEFWVSGLPAGWLTFVTPNPASNVALGNPFATVPPLRANIAFGRCMPPDGNGVVLLYSVVLVPLSVVSDACLTPRVAIPPSNPQYVTPIFGGCDMDLLDEAAGLPFLVNPVTGGCVVAVEPVTWSSVKRLYRQ